ncbi:polysaccharide biosynthesis/export family protein [Flagellimonas sp. HMM57]|uniref:polysaccharide biosynthesis/export family protein n=1 Tax=unclassified Flagellimonas TaxID=2644544 RepID=UPI0013D59DE0|nr:MULTISPECIES: polysaccharide biosynthesis/export family protein [unclassified Flagellimonas]UII76114.1 polysaccharide biosynthesis/export family protein [Flagellimonas sp. HMM57]
MYKKSSNFWFFSVIITTLLLSSCASKQDIVYFQDATNFETLINDNNFSPTFKVDDLISIHVSTLNPEASAPFNLVVGVSDDVGANNNAGGGGSQVSYLVDKDGNIDFPVLGKVKVEGLSQEDLRVKLRSLLSDYLKDPIINIRILNFTVTILGEVNRPGTYPVIGEQITILEALGLAGDLNIRGMRKNILVIRDFDGTKVYNRIDLTSKEAMKSPVYYLTQNDVVYVEPNKAAVDASASTAGLTITLSLVGLVLGAATLIVTANR